MSHGLRHLDRPLGEAILGAWAERVLTTRPPAPGELAALAIEGKTLRGRRQQGAPAAHRRSGRSHRRGRTLGPQAGADQTPAIPVLEAGWRGLGVEGRGSTVEAVLTQRAIAPRLMAGGGDSVMVVKGHPPPRPHDIPLLLQDVDTGAAPMAAVETVDVGQGRLEPRRVPPSPALVGYRDGPGLAQVFQRERRVPMKARAVQRAAVVDGVSSLSPEQACPERVRGVVRPHGQIEHNVHGVRDVTFEEDHSHVRSGSIPQVMAAVRHTAIGVMPWVGETPIAAACRRFAAQPWAALALIGISPDN